MEPNEYPPNDTEHQDYYITKVEPSQPAGGWAITNNEGWSIFISDSPITPEIGMVIRYYGQGIGYLVRGIFIAGTKIYYRTEEEEKEYREIERYGSDAAEWLRRWDADKSVWSIEMGGLGPGYEQCIQLTAAEILRVLLAKAFDHTKWGDKDAWKTDRDEIDAATRDNAVIKRLGLSGAQWGAALSLATGLYMKGPRGVMTDSNIKEGRHIQVRKTFPQ